VYVLVRVTKEEKRMDVRNCKDCGKLFNYLNGPALCPTCMKKLDDKFTVVKEYIYNHPGAGIQEVSEENEVSIPQIKQWIREERLAFAEDSMVGIECENCGTTIRTGRFCQSCKDKLANNLGNVYRTAESPQLKKDTKESPKMRFLDN
jgi:flagellar operon protein (TIGR03826 family)